MNKIPNQDLLDPIEAALETSQIIVDVLAEFLKEKEIPPHGRDRRGDVGQSLRGDLQGLIPPPLRRGDSRRPSHS